MALFKQVFDDKTLCDDFIYEDIAGAGEYVSTERKGVWANYHDIAFYRNGSLFRAVWSTGDNGLVITQLTYGAGEADRAMEEMIDICTACNRDDTSIFCNYSYKRIDGVTAILKADYYCKA